MGKTISEMTPEEKFPMLLGHLAEMTNNFDELYKWLQDHQSNKKGNPSDMCKNLSINDLKTFFEMVVNSKFIRDPKPIIKMMKE